MGEKDRRLRVKIKKRDKMYGFRKIRGKKMSGRKQVEECGEIKSGNGNNMKSIGNMKMK